MSLGTQLEALEQGERKRNLSELVSSLETSARKSLLCSLLFYLCCTEQRGKDRVMLFTGSLAGVCDSFSHLGLKCERLGFKTRLTQKVLW